METNDLGFVASLLFILVNHYLDNINLPLVNLANHYLANINLPLVNLINHYLTNINHPLVNLDNHILASLYKVTLPRVMFPKVNLSRGIRQATNQVLRKAIQPN